MVTLLLLGNFKESLFQAGVEELLAAYKELGLRMSLKMHFHFLDLDFFPTNQVAVSNEEGKGFIRTF